MASSALAGAELLLPACSRSGNSFRFRLTIEVETPVGRRTGSGVMEIIAGNTVGILPDAAQRGMRLLGEAVAVDLPGGKVLFALLPDARLVQSVLDPGWKNDWVESTQRITSGQVPKGPQVMHPGKPKPYGMESGYPLLVTFLDIQDPASVERVDPTEFVMTFGEGTELKAIKLEVTSDPVSTGIEKRLRWLTKSLKGYDFHPEGIPVGNFRGLFTTDLTMTGA